MVAKEQYISTSNFQSKLSKNFQYKILTNFAFPSRGGIIAYTFILGTSYKMQLSQRTFADQVKYIADALSNLPSKEQHLSSKLKPITRKTAMH